MLKFSEVKTNFTNVISNVISENLSEELATYVTSVPMKIFDKYSALGVYIIFDDLETYVEWLRAKTYEIIPLLNLTENGLLKLSDSKVGSRDVDTTIFGANEFQPLNANIDEITSPTAKSKSVRGSGENWSESSPHEARENIKMQMEYTVTQILKNAYMPMFEFYSKIY